MGHFETEFWGWIRVMSSLRFYWGKFHLERTFGYFSFDYYIVPKYPLKHRYLGFGYIFTS